ncbi:hypothetical protein DN412_00875 [Cupriavidus lacunae]|uniref:Polysaccharide biosynthesis protein n=2 Tax=Cupriavidus lacunae TaxID=2666307 RepID=A0A370P2P3_9BURK|nr:hypothetical protein DN412_00875 [Cupriavidus lacunae]
MRAKLAPAYLTLAVAISFVYQEWLILLVALYRFGDLLYEPVFCEKMRNGDARGMLVGSGGRLVVFLLGLMPGFTLGLGPVQTLAILATLNIVMAAWSAGSSWYASIRRVALKGGDFLMGAAACLASLSVNVPRYFLVGAHEGDLAAYSNILTVMMAGTLLFVSFNNMFFARATRVGRDGVVSFFLRSSLLGLLATSLAWLLIVDNYQVAKVLVQFGLGASYLPYAILLPLFWIFYCALYLQNVANCVLIYAGGSRQIFLSNFLLLIFLAIGFMGLPGAISAYRALIIAVAAMGVFLLLIISLAVVRLRSDDGLSRNCAA